MTKRTIPLALLSLAYASQSVAQEPPEVTPLYEEVLVTGGADAIRTLSGSASFIDEESIRAFDSTDLNELLGQVPGVYIRFEDGYGLRPNIGIRGATSERSQKITLMEDGMLIAPAPYSAPAAYYIPNVNRMAAVEVFKGPAAIPYGPHTVGGALNLVSPKVPEDARGELDLAAGSDDYRKVRARYGDTVGQFGYDIDVLHYGADGFKQLDSGGDTGFRRNDANLRLMWRSADNAELDQQLELKLGYADEDSDETYLGLTDDDFGADPDRRYVASELDTFESEHRQAHLLHSLSGAEHWDVFTTAYVNQFDRSWNKFDGFIDGQPPSLVLAYPNIFIDEMALLRGEAFSDPDDESTIIDVTNNDREYGSSGIESRLTWRLSVGETEHRLRTGLRYHYDYVKRDHKVRGYLMTAEGLVTDGLGERYKKALNKAETDAWSGFVEDEMQWGDWKFNVGVRYEHIEGEFDNELTDTRSDNSESIVLPGAGLFYQWTDDIGFLLGVNKGFSPAGPGADDSVDPEDSVNYEYGVRFTRDTMQFDLIGFFSDYANLLGRCRVSDPSCEVGEEFNGGEVEISGAEVTANYVGAWVDGLTFPVELSYTYTESSFQNSFLSDFSQWGLVRAGDELPYTPEHQGRLQVGVANYRWSVYAAVKYIGKMRELPGQDSFNTATSTRSLTTWNLSANYDITEDLTLRLIGENLSDEREIVSRRPFGARPNQPRVLKVGVNYRF
ncbi:hypothetical protein BST95_10300 [Halioglobus japonicus]|nr:TonB-dependent receptor [Halioglobus japonicus]AQA18565.1 hypothetical protein BST95_10300 [Halioglobus japonicus]GHD12095.1 TonB-dependent receptor [Halioglobus japonicus]